jgi:oligopeptide transport system permease protein
MSDPTQPASGVAAPQTFEPLPTPTEPGLPREQEQVRSLGRDAWRDLRRNPVFLVSVVIVFILVVMAIWPGLFTNTDPYKGDLQASRLPPSREHWFGTDVQGRDVYARTIYGARASIAVGLLTTLTTLFFGSLLGVLAGFYGKWADSIISRVAEIFLSIPLLLGGVLVLSSFPGGANPSFWSTVAKVVLALFLIAWPQFMRLMRSSVIQVRLSDYVQAARALGATGPRLITSHIVPNALSPVIVYATISLGIYIAAEATLSYLGIGLQPPTVSWGIAIADAQNYIRVSPYLLLFPGAFLSLTVLAFIMMGDALRDALDPKLR